VTVQGLETEQVLSMLAMTRLVVWAGTMTSEAQWVIV
jgi:hypothetical protein